MAYRKMTCPECSKVLRPAKPVPAGKKVRCPECENVFYPEDSINPVEAIEDEEGSRARSGKPAQAKKGGKDAAKPEAEAETYGYVKEDVDAEKENKPKIIYAADTSVKDLRGPAVAIVMGPSNKLTLVGFAGVAGWLMLIILLMIPALFPLKPDESKKRPVMKVKPGLSHVSSPAAGAGGGGGFPGGGFPGGGGGQTKAPPKIEEEKAGLYDVGGYDLGSIADLEVLFFMVALLPLIFCTFWAALVSFGAIQMQNLQSRAWGIVGSIMAMMPITIAGLQLVTAMVVQIVLIQVIDDMSFINYVVVVVTSAEWLACFAAGVWALATLFNKKVVAGFEYVAE